MPEKDYPLINLKGPNGVSGETIASVCDHTFLFRPESYLPTAKQDESPVRLREKAFYNFLSNTIELTSRGMKPYAVCVRPEDCEHAKRLLMTKDLSCKTSDIKIASVVGFPSGNWYSTDFKLYEAKLAIRHGANEIDMVLDYDKIKVGAIKEYAAARKDVEDVTKFVHQKKKPIKLIFETSELCTPELIETACKIANQCGVDFVKTSTGFGSKGATPEALALIKKYARCGIKMSGKVKRDNAPELLNALSDGGYLKFNPMKIRIGESSLLEQIAQNTI